MIANQKQMTCLAFFFFICLLGQLVADPLPSWNEGYAKKAILEFIHQVTQPKSKNFIPLEERIAVFDQDGTLWVEQPIYTEFRFALDMMMLQAHNHPEWRNIEPFRSILMGNLDKVYNFSEQDIVKIIAMTHTGMSIDAFHAEVANWLSYAIHPRFKRHFTQLIYQPMLEVMHLLWQFGFKVYIVSGSGQEFLRVYAERVYGIPPEHIIGSPGKTKYEYQKDGSPVLIKLPDLLFSDNKGGKPEGINLIIGRRPIIAFGNSTGDQQMLEWTQAGKRMSLELLVHHDDVVREYAYGPESKIGTFSDALMQEAKERGWIVISMKHDWKVIFPWQRNE